MWHDAPRRVVCEEEILQVLGKTGVSRSGEFVHELSHRPLSPFAPRKGVTLATLKKSTFPFGVSFSPFRGAKGDNQYIPNRENSQESPKSASLSPSSKYRSCGRWGPRRVLR